MEVGAGQRPSPGAGGLVGRTETEPTRGTCPRGEPGSGSRGGKGASQVLLGELKPVSWVRAHITEAGPINPRCTTLAGLRKAFGVAEIQRQGTEIRKVIVSFAKQLGLGALGAG